MNPEFQAGLKTHGIHQENIMGYLRCPNQRPKARYTCISQNRILINSTQLEPHPPHQWSPLYAAWLKLHLSQQKSYECRILSLSHCEQNSDGWDYIGKLADLMTKTWTRTQIVTFWTLWTIVGKVFGHVPRARILINWCINIQGEK